jgi:Flp pilus assembly protein TadD
VVGFIPAGKTTGCAIQDLSEAVRLDPDDAETHLARAEAFERKGKVDEAERDRAAARVGLCKAAR